MVLMLLFHFFSFQKVSVGTSIIIKPWPDIICAPLYCLQYVLHVNKYTTFLEEHFRSSDLIK